MPMANKRVSRYRYKCPTATTELEELHFSYLNQAYHPNVISSWKTDGCFNDIHRYLGYRLVLKKVLSHLILETDLLA